MTIIILHFLNTYLFWLLGHFTFWDSFLPKWQLLVSPICWILLISLNLKSLVPKNSCVRLFSSVCIHDLIVSRLKISLVRTCLTYRLLSTIAYWTPPYACLMPKLLTHLHSPNLLLPKFSPFSKWKLYPLAQAKNLELSLTIFL